LVIIDWFFLECATIWVANDHDAPFGFCCGFSLEYVFAYFGYDAAAHERNETLIVVERLAQLVVQCSHVRTLHASMPLSGVGGGGGVGVGGGGEQDLTRRPRRGLALVSRHEP